MTANADGPTSDALTEGIPENVPEETGSKDNPAATKAASEFVILAQFIRDLSFEVPNAPGIFSAMQEKQPDININVDVRATQIKGESFGVTLMIRAECKAGGELAFIMELSYGSLVRATLSRDALAPALLIEVPRLMFPFARNIIADMSREGGFPPLMLAPVDFASLYREKLAQESAGNTDQNKTGSSHQSANGSSVVKH